MKYIKKFEELDFSQTLPIASKNALTMYYSCDDCDAIWRKINTKFNDCIYCNSNNIEELSEDEWYEIVKSRSEDEEEVENWRKERNDNDNFMISLNDLNKKNNYGN